MFAKTEESPKKEKTIKMNAIEYQAFKRENRVKKLHEKMAWIETEKRF